MKSLRFEAWASISIAVLLLVALVMPGGGEQFDNVRDAARTIVPLDDGQGAAPPR